MELSRKQIETLTKIDIFARLLGVDPKWAKAVALVESSAGEHQLSPTGAKGVFQMTTIAMKDLLQLMQSDDDDYGDIFCGVWFLSLLLKRHGNIEDATKKFCAPSDRGFYISKVKQYMEIV